MDMAETFVLKAFENYSLEAAIKALHHGAALTETQVCLPGGSTEERMLINGNQAIALGALAAGVTFYAAYPMTPFTGIANALAA